MSIVWSKLALADLRNIKAYIANDNPNAASRVVKTIIIHVESQLGIFPASGRTGRVKGTHKFAIPRSPYIVIYRLKDKQIDIVRIHHTSRLWPEDL